MHVHPSLVPTCPRLGVGLACQRARDPTCDESNHEPASRLGRATGRGAPPSLVPPRSPGRNPRPGHRRHPRRVQRHHGDPPEGHPGKLGPLERGRRRWTRRPLCPRQQQHRGLAPQLRPAFHPVPHGRILPALLPMEGRRVPHGRGQRHRQQLVAGRHLRCVFHPGRHVRLLPLGFQQLDGAGQQCLRLAQGAQRHLSRRRRRARRARGLHRGHARGRHDLRPLRLQHRGRPHRCAA